MEKRAVHFIASSDKKLCRRKRADEHGERVAGIQYNIAKANRTDRKVQNLANLVKRMKSGSYRPNPTRRVYIPKETKGKMRPLGISCYEDKLVENAIAQILDQLPEILPGQQGEWDREYVHQKTGEVRWFHVSAFCSDIQGEKKYILVMSDRTKDKKINQALEDAVNAAQSANRANCASRIRVSV